MLTFFLGRHVLVSMYVSGLPGLNLRISESQNLNGASTDTRQSRDDKLAQSLFPPLSLFPRSVNQTYHRLFGTIDHHPKVAHSVVVFSLSINLNSTLPPFRLYRPSFALPFLPQLPLHPRHQIALPFHQNTAIIPAFTRPSLPPPHQYPSCPPLPLHTGSL
jgi:hypothetical protein